jgi:hypothetical protein
MGFMKGSCGLKSKGNWKSGLHEGFVRPKIQGKMEEWSSSRVHEVQSERENKKVVVMKGS